MGGTFKQGYALSMIETLLAFSVRAFAIICTIISF